MTHTRSAARTPVGIRARAVGLLVAPLPALAIGVHVMSRAGVPSALWMQNVAAALAGIVVVLLPIGRCGTVASGPGAPRWIVPAGLVLLGATLVTPGVEGIHRWLPLGPLRVHAGALLLPPLLVLAGRSGWSRSLAVALSVLTILWIQPDGAQAASFAAGWSVFAAATRRRMAIGAIIVVAVVAAATLLRPDPLEPVPHVEGILGMAAAQGLFWAVVGLAALALVPTALLLSPSRVEGAALAIYLTCTLMAARLGNFPVPILGFGVSPILGYYCGVLTLLLIPGRREAPAPRRR